MCAPRGVKAGVSACILGRLSVDLFCLRVLNRTGEGTPATRGSGDRSVSRTRGAHGSKISDPSVRSEATFQPLVTSVLKIELETDTRSSYIQIPTLYTLLSRLPTESHSVCPDLGSNDFQLSCVRENRCALLRSVPHYWQSPGGSAVRSGTRVHGPTASARPSCSTAAQTVLYGPGCRDGGGERATRWQCARAPAPACSGAAMVPAMWPHRVMMMTVTSERPVRGEGTAGFSTRVV